VWENSGRGSSATTRRRPRDSSGVELRHGPSSRDSRPLPPCVPLSSLSAHHTDAKCSQLKYADTVIQPPFESAESPLRSLESAELITITHAHGRPSLILPGKPLYKTAFARLLDDAVFAATIEWGINDGGIKKQKSDLEAAVKGLRELEGLGGTWSGSVETRRGKWREKMRVAEGKLEALEKQKKELEAVLKAEV
jgi:hypothetical protein